MILALDLGTNCGWALLDETGKRLKSGTWRLNKNTGADRWNDFSEKLHALLEATILEHDEPVCLAFEKVRRHAGTIAAHVYGALQALAQMKAAEFGVVLRPIEVSTWKKLATGNGSASKAQYVDAMNKLFKMKMDVKKREDEAAALGVGVAALEQLKKEKR